MPKYYAEGIDVDVDEFLDDCTLDQIEEVFQWLKDSSYLPENMTSITTRQSFQDEEFDGALTHLVGKRFQLTTEQEAAIINITSNIH